MNSNKSQDSTRILARMLYDGTGAPGRPDVVVEITDGIITRVVPWQRGSTTNIEEYPVLSPGLIDIQINGANDRQFNDSPTVEALAGMAEGAAKGGTAWILPTFITAPEHDYLAAISSARRAIETGVPGILGLHLEGPFLSPERPGIHEPGAIRRISETDLEALTAGFPGPLLLTAAPEEMPAGALQRLTQAGVIVFAGHSAASYAQMAAAEADGLRGVTHLFNAMSQITVREPGVVGAALASKRLFAGLIADGHHVHWANIGLAGRLMPDRLCLVTDAMCTLAGTRTGFSARGERISLRDGRLTSADGTLAGAHIAMDASIRNLIDHGITAPELAVRMATLNPASALKLQHSIGRVVEGMESGLTAFDRDWQAVAVWHGGLGCKAAPPPRPVFPG